MAQLFRDEEITNLRATVQTLMTSTVALVGVTRTVDTLGGVTESTTTGTSSVCLISPINAREAVQFSRIDTRNRYRVFLPFDFVVTNGDRLIIDSVTYEVESIESPESPDIIQKIAMVFKHV